MSNAIITWASGDKFLDLPELQVFFNSIKRLDLSENCIVFTHNMSVGKEEQLIGEGFQVVRVGGKDIHLVVRDRFLEIYRWLAVNSRKYDQVLLTDSKDVVFQSNPFSYSAGISSADRYVFLCHEGGEHYQSEWNAGNQIKYQMSIKPFEQSFTHAPIINSGFILGTAEEIKNLSLLVWTNSISIPFPLSEQATLNYLYFYLKEDPVYNLIHPKDYCLCLTGEGVVRDWLDFSPMPKKGMIYHPTLDMPFCAFHQWERTKFKDLIVEAYLNVEKS